MDKQLAGLKVTRGLLPFCRENIGFILHHLKGVNDLRASFNFKISFDNIIKKEDNNI